MSNRFSKQFKEEGLIYLLIVASLILLWIPYMGQGFTKGAEVEFHYARIMTLADSIKTGIFPAKIRPTHMKLFGYGIGFFYPDILIYPPAALIAMGLGYDITMKVYLFVLTLCESCVTYRALKDITGSKWISLIGEILILNSAVNDQNIFDGGGMPHLFAYLFIPLAICGLLRALEDKKGAYIQFALGLTMVLLTHNMIFLTMMFAMIFIVLVHIKNIIKKPIILLKLIGVSLAAMLCTTAYWLPAMEQVSHIRFIVFNDNAYEVTDHILQFGRLVVNDVGVTYFAIFGLAIILYGFIFVKNKKMPLDVTSMLITNIIVIWFMCSHAVWNSAIGDALSFFEYTNRFEYVLVNMMVIFAALTMREAVSCFNLSDVLDKKAVLLYVICAVVLVGSRFIARPGFLNPAGEDRIDLYYDMLMEDWQVSGAEWLPMECEPSACTAPENARADDGSSADGFKHDNAKYFEVWVDMDKEYYDMPYVYYYGYKAYILDDNNNPVEELEVGEAFDDNGYVRVFMPKDKSGFGHVMTTYRKTEVQKISYVITILSVLAAVIGIILQKRQLRHQ